LQLANNNPQKGN